MCMCVCKVPCDRLVSHPGCIPTDDDWIWTDSPLYSGIYSAASVRWADMLWIRTNFSNFFLIPYFGTRYEYNLWFTAVHVLIYRFFTLSCWMVLIMNVQQLMKSSAALASVAFLTWNSKPSSDKEEHTESSFQLYLLWMQITCGLT